MLYFPLSSYWIKKCTIVWGTQCVVSVPPPAINTAA